MATKKNGAATPDKAAEKNNKVSKKETTASKATENNNDALPTTKKTTAKSAVVSTAKQKKEEKAPINQPKRATTTTPEKEAELPKIATAATTTAAKKTTKKEKGKEIAAKRADAAPVLEVVSKVIATAKPPKHISFQLRYHTTYGQELFIVGSHPALGNNQIEQAIPLAYLNDQYWVINLSFDAHIDTPITYNYVLKNADGVFSYDWGSDKSFTPSLFPADNIVVIDAWNYAGYYENAFYSVPFHDVLLKANDTPTETPTPKDYTHIFKVKAPLLEKGQTLCLVGSSPLLGNWTEAASFLVLTKKLGAPFFEAAIDLSKETFPIAYKYGVYDIATKKLVRLEAGENRTIQLHTTNEVPPSHTPLTIVNDGFVVLPADTWKGAGLAIPVFSLKTANSFGVGEFTDIHALVDWSKQTGLKMIQLLPVNDTTATHTWVDSYPYAAISAFALHPLYLNLSQVAESEAAKELVAAHDEERIRLNDLTAIDYEAVMILKWKITRQLFLLQYKATFQTEDFKQFFDLNKHWLIPYACFCYLRDTNGSADFVNWPSYQQYREPEIAPLLDEAGEAYLEVVLHYFIQYHLHVQLKAATDYAHQNGIIVKGDIAIGIYRNGADAWQNPKLYNLELQAGAPPDDFAVKGQNWGFPTYNWERMRQDGFTWWKQRFEQMGYYFDAFRIDHILGFFRIWSIPLHAVEGIMGNFVPATPVNIHEFYDRGIRFDFQRFTQPFINETVLWELFGYDNEYAKSHFLQEHGYGHYSLKAAFNTQRKVEQYLESWNDDAFTKKIKQGLFDLISNVIMFEEEGSNGQSFHFRFNISSTSSYRNLDEHTRRQLDALYVDYFFRRQDKRWLQEALQKLPALKRVTNMLICGEDLGLVPACLPEVMKQLGLLSLEIQRMPKDPSKTFFHPNDAPYLSVVTPSTHDMSTIRGWWEEDKNKIQQFFNYELGQWGNAPYYCEGWINKAIVEQHLYSPAMWSVFQLQDLLGMDDQLRRVNPSEERINIPANPKHYWRYRMNLSLEELQKADAFNDLLSEMIVKSGRG